MSGYDSMPEIGSRWRLHDDVVDTYFPNDDDFNGVSRYEEWEVTEIVTCPFDRMNDCGKAYNCPGYMTMKGLSSGKELKTSCYIFGHMEPLFVPIIDDEDKRFGVRMVIGNLFDER